jgi:hypothetical protein
MNPDLCRVAFVREDLLRVRKRLPRRRSEAGVVLEKGKLALGDLTERRWAWFNASTAKVTKDAHDASLGGT